MALGPRSRLLALILAPVLVAGVAAFVYATRDPQEPGGPIEVSGSMPVLEGETLTGERLEPSDYFGEVVVVNFWAAWCVPCRQEQPDLQRLWEEMGDRGVQLVGVNFQDDRAAALAYVEEFGVTYPSVEDDGPLAHEFGVPYLPATIIVGTDGEMRYKLLGAQSEEVLRRHVEELL